MTSEPGEPPTGQTQDAGFQMGVRRTLPISLEDAWQWVTSPEGVAAWLTPVDDLDLTKGASYVAADGSEGELRVFKPMSHLRITYRPDTWEQPSTIQVRVIGKRERTVVAFHEEHLASTMIRERRLAHFRSALKELEATITGKTED